jgi:UPF0176 protein
MTRRIATLYHFTTIEDPVSKRQPLLDFCLERNLLGTLLLAHEGVNGTVAGSDDSIHQLICYLEDWDEIDTLDVKYSTTSTKGFLRMKVRLKNEIVTMGQADIDPNTEAGLYVDPKDWNALISAPDVMVVDTRNIYETRIGCFKGAVDPTTETFRAFPDWADQLAKKPNRPKKIAMYCTGGIRCEKASAYMKKIGFDDVRHLKGGILKYLEEIPEDQSLWEGECFVFDERVSLKHGLEEGDYDLCFACKDPISDADRLKDGFEDGVSCHRCINKYSASQQQKFRERHRQIKLATARGENHLGHASFSSKRRRKVL